MNLKLLNNHISKLFLRICAAVTIGFSSDIIITTFADEVDSFNDTISRKVFELSESGKCADAWKLIWPHVLRGSNRASAELVGEMTFGNIHPPAASPNPGNMKNDEYMRFVADLLFQIDPEKTTSAKDAFDAKKAFLSEVWDEKVFAAYESSGCLKQGAKAICFDPNLWSGMVRTLSKWRQTFNSNETLGLTSRCRDKK
jgi:hypothetical protein